MTTDGLINVFHEMVATVSSSDDLRQCWHRVLDIAGERRNATLSSVDIESDLDSIVAQLKNTLRVEPPSSEIRILWFGIFDVLHGHREYAGYYVAGWMNEKQLREGGPPSFLPQSRYITSQLLNTIKSEAVRLRGESARFALFDYAVMFAAAATLSRFAVRSLGIAVPIYVGFDSGDFARIAN